MYYPPIRRYAAGKTSLNKITIRTRINHTRVASGLELWIRTCATVALRNSIFYHSSVSCVIMYDGLGRIFLIKLNISVLSSEMRLDSFFMASALPSASGRLLFSVCITQICRFFFSGVDGSQLDTGGCPVCPLLLYN